ncbi:MAG: hypothetical protein K8F31_08245 [Roseovarius sp.]|nr:hypothetical protein [Roseovarius sp.]
MVSEETKILHGELFGRLMAQRILIELLFARLTQVKDFHPTSLISEFNRSMSSIDDLNLPEAVLDAADDEMAAIAEALDRGLQRGRELK